MMMLRIAIVLCACIIATPAMPYIKMIKNASGAKPTQPEFCLVTCAGSTGAGTTKWAVHSADKMVTEVDMTECGFIDTPVVTTSLSGSGWHDLQKGTSAPWSITKTGFLLAVLDNGKAPSESLATENKWHVNWIAVGFFCDYKDGDLESKIVTP
ncbi:hypothetical protein ACHWQZ_G013851 [Mnemiopsis leidyi]